MTVEELNASILNDSIDEIIRVAEARQVKALSKIADRICERPGLRLVLLAGASSAGKTTTAKRLCTQLRVNGRQAMLLSTDDYFVGDAKNPRDENGELDYEHINCVDIACLTRDINDLLAGKPVARRIFDFQKHQPVHLKEKLNLPAGGIAVLEGIHALNPILTEGIDDAVKFRVFIEPQPSLDVFGGITQTPACARFLRRLVRDNHFRHLDPVETLRLWPKVLAGEKKWIEPFRSLVDATFDSYLVYELAVLKPYAGGLLEKARRQVGEETLIMEMIHLLELVHVFSPITVPGDSILRETIGGSSLDY